MLPCLCKMVRLNDGPAAVLSSIAMHYDASALCIVISYSLYSFNNIAPTNVFNLLGKGKMMIFYPLLGNNICYLPFVFL